MNQRTSYVIYDISTGRILGTHTRIDGDTGKSVPLGDTDVVAACGLSLDERARSKVKVLAVDAATLRSRTGLRVHTKRQELVPRDHLDLKLSRAEIRGDGEDSVDIEIRVVQSSGKPDDTFNGRIKVSTQRGRLSEPGGIVQAKGGLAKISLRSVPETIDRVRISANDIDGELDTGRATVAFL